MFSKAITTAHRFPFRKESISIAQFRRFIQIVAQNMASATEQVSHRILSLEKCQQRVDEELTRFDIENERLKVEETDLPDAVESAASESYALLKQKSENEATIAQLQKILLEKEAEFFKTVYEKEESTLKSGLQMAKDQFDQSIQFLHTIRKDDIDELKSYTVPPPVIGQLAETLCIIFDKPLGWQEAKKLLVSNTFMQRLMNVSDSALSFSKLEKLRKYTELSSFHSDRMLNVSVAARALSQWVRGLSHFGWVRSQMSTDAQIAAKIRKMCALKMSKTEERTHLDRLKRENIEIQGKISKLNALRRIEIGRLAILREISTPKSVFSHVEDVKDDLSISQWIQQAFHCEEDGLYFDNPEVREAHELYHKSLLDIDQAENSLFTLNEETKAGLSKLRNAFLSLELADLTELVQNKEDQNPYTIYARRIFLQLFGVHQNMAVEELYDEVRFSFFDSN